jgi:hypothetical protein
MLDTDFNSISEANAVIPKKKRKKKVIEASEEQIVPVVTSSSQCLPTNTVMPQFALPQPVYYPSTASYAFGSMYPNQMAPYFFPIMPPMSTAHQNNAVRKPQQEFCCLPHYQHMTAVPKKKGRPPHDPVNWQKYKSFQF